MLIDGLTITDESLVSRHLMDQSKIGTQFPSSPVDQQVFELSETYNGYAPGIYQYVSAESKWVVKYPNFDVMPYDVSGAVFGIMKDADVVARHIAVRSYRVKEGFAGCIAVAKTAPVVDCALSVILVSRTGAETTLGALTFSAAETVGIFQQSTSGDMVVGAGETLVLQAPNPVDQSISDIAFTFAGTLL